MRRKHNLKNPNGFGGVAYLGPNRRNPYRARVTTGWDDNGKQMRDYVGPAMPNYEDAYEELCKYNKKPYNLNYKNVPFKYVYEKVLENITSDFENGKLSESSYKCLKAAYNQNLKDLNNRKFVELEKDDIQRIIDNSGLKYTGRNYIKILFTMMVDYCNDKFKLKLDTDIYKKLDLKVKEKSDKHKPILVEHINIIKELAKTNDLAKMIMIYLYTGYRPSELLQIENEKVFLKEDYMVGGIKTDAGIDRLMPIHSDIKEYVEYFYDPNNKYLIINKNTGGPMTYDVLKKRFKKLMELLGLNYLPDDPRHTFATKCAEIELPDRIIKLLMGHSLADDVTDDVYIHVSKDILKKYIERIKY